MHGRSGSIPRSIALGSSGVHPTRNIGGSVSTYSTSCCVYSAITVQALSFCTNLYPLSSWVMCCRLLPRISETLPYFKANKGVFQVRSPKQTKKLQTEHARSVGYRSSKYQHKNVPGLLYKDDTRADVVDTIPGTGQTFSCCRGCTGHYDKHCSL